MMLQRISDRLTDQLILKGVIPEENQEIYTYGFSALLSTVINALVMLIIGILSGLLLETFIFMLSFAVLRVYSGGYHADSHISCILMSASIYAIAMLITQFMPVQYSVIFSVLIGVISFFAIIIFAPIEHKNKPFIEDEYKKFKLISRMIAACEIGVICIIAIFFSKIIRIAVVLSLAMLGVSFVLILAKIIEKRRRTK